MDIRGLDVGYYNCLFYSLIFLSPILVFLFAQRNSRLPPGPFAWPVIGNLFDLEWKSAHISLAKLAQSYGPIMSLRFGARLAIVASSPEAAREVLKTHDRDLSGRYVPQILNRIPQIHTSIMGLATDCNERWRFLRSTSHMGLFSAKALESCSRIRLEKAKEMLHFLGSKEGEVVNIADILFATTANTLTNAMLSQDIVESWNNIGEVKRKSRKMLGIVILSLADLYPAIGGLDFWIKQKAVEANQIYRAVWGDIVSKRRGGRQDSNQDILDVLIESSFDDYQIYNFLSELFPSSEAVSSVVEWAMIELTRNQEASSKLRDEIMTKDIEGTALSEKRLTKLPYLQACIKETLRLHPPDPILVPRCALQTCQIMNYRIPKNSLMIVNAYALGRDEKTWEDAQNFKPERFLGRNFDVKGPHYELLPFGGGRRMCPGQHWALTEIQLLLGSLVYAFDWLVPPGTDPESLDMSEKLIAITLKREKPLLLIPKMKNDVSQDWAEALGTKGF
nr:probable (S)-N-methylcoclaurine 3'-hydroxylase isozyme 2 [Coffea arabica]